MVVGRTRSLVLAPASSSPVVKRKRATQLGGPDYIKWCLCLFLLAHEHQQELEHVQERDV